MCLNWLIDNLNRQINPCLRKKEPQFMYGVWEFTDARRHQRFRRQKGK